MSVQEKVSAEQWKALFNAPGAASTYVSTASGGGGLEILKEVMTASKYAQELSAKAGGSGYGEIVDEILTVMKGMTLKEAQANTIDYQSKDPDAIRAALKNVVAQAAAVVAPLPGADGFKRWILETARQVAETKTGGFLGIGAKAVIDEKEQAALDELAALFGG